VRKNALVSITLLALGACSHASTSEATASPSPAGTPLPLRSCEERRLTLDGAELFIQANADQTPAQILILSAPDDESRAKAYQDARKLFGDPKPDPRTQTRQYKLGLTQVTDMCGRPVMPSPSPSPVSS
jgi:hypothetical protein